MKETDNNEHEMNYKDCGNWMKRGHHHHVRRGPNGGAVYGLGFIGAAIFFIGHATTFWAGVLGFFQAMVWPAFLVYEALKVLIK